MRGEKAAGAVGGGFVCPLLLFFFWCGLVRPYVPRSGFCLPLCCVCPLSFVYRPSRLFSVSSRFRGLHIYTYMFNVLLLTAFCSCALYPLPNPYPCSTFCSCALVAVFEPNRTEPKVLGIRDGSAAGQGDRRGHPVQRLLRVLRAGLQAAPQSGERGKDGRPGGRLAHNRLLLLLLSC